MKELDLNNLTKEKTKTEVTQQKEQEYQLVYQGTIIPNENHTLWEVDIKSLEIVKATYLKKDYMFNPKWTKNSKPNTHSEVVINEGKAYVSALNKSNALKKFKKGSNGSKLDSGKSYLQL